MSKLTRKEHHDIARILFGLIIDMDLPDGISNIEVLKATRAMLDFLFLAQYPVHSTESLSLLKDALNHFHASKDIFITLGIQNDFNLPKLHFLIHYIENISWLGTTDNFNTEYTECLHIDFAKDAYEATNHKDELPQMTLWLEQKEKVQQFESYIKWPSNGCPPILSFSSLSNMPSSRIKLTKQPSMRNVPFEILENDYGATYIEDALARYVAQHDNPNATSAQIEKLAKDIEMPFDRLHVFQKAKF